MASLVIKKSCEMFDSLQ